MAWAPAASARIGTAVPAGVRVPLGRPSPSTLSGTLLPPDHLLSEEDAGRAGGDPGLECEPREGLPLLSRRPRRSFLAAHPTVSPPGIFT